MKTLIISINIIGGLFFLLFLSFFLKILDLSYESKHKIQVFNSLDILEEKESVFSNMGYPDSIEKYYDEDCFLYGLSTLSADSPHLMLCFNDKNQLIRKQNSNF